MEMRSLSQRNVGGTTAISGTRVRGIHSKPSAQEMCIRDRLITNGETGMLFSPRDHETMARCILALANDEALRKRLGQAVYEKAKREFSTESTCRRQLKIYKTVLERYSRPRSGAVILSLIHILPGCEDIRYGTTYCSFEKRLFIFLYLSMNFSYTSMCGLPR